MKPDRKRKDKGNAQEEAQYPYGADGYYPADYPENYGGEGYPANYPEGYADGYNGYGYPDGYGYPADGQYTENYGYPAEGQNPEGYGYPENGQYPQGYPEAPQEGAYTDGSPYGGEQPVGEPEKAEKTDGAEQTEQPENGEVREQAEPEGKPDESADVAEEIPEPQKPVSREADPELQKKLEQAQAAADDYKRKWYSVTAEYDNYRKRTKFTKTQSYAEGRADVVSKLFPIGDNLDRALQSCSDASTRKGIEMVLAAFAKLLSDEGIAEINPVGQEFSPTECEAIMAVDPKEGQPSGIVVEVYRKGYEQNGKILRYAQVVVTK